MTSLSVVICTHNRAAMLGDALATLGAQRHVDGRMEIIVVDDGSTDETRGTVHEAGLTPPVRYVYQENAGANAARNRGTAVATSPLVAYLDDDVLVPPCWAADLLAGAAAHPAAAAMAGSVRLRFEEPAPAWLTPRLHHWLSALDLGHEPAALRAPANPVAANMAVRHDVWDAVGGFDETIDRRGGVLLSNGENELFQRVRAAGGTVIGWPAAWVYHRVPPARLTRSWFRRRARAQGVSDVQLDLRARPPIRRSRVREMARASRAVPIALGSLHDGGPFRAVLWLEYCRGRISALRSTPRRTATRNRPPSDQQ